MKVVNFPSSITGRRGYLAVLEIEFTTKARRVRVKGFDGLEPLDLRGEGPGGTYEVSESLTRLHVPLRVTRDGAGQGTVRVTVEDAPGRVPPESWEGNVALTAPKASGATAKKAVLLGALAAVAALVVFFVLPLFSEKKLPSFMGKSRADAESMIASLGYDPVVKWQDVGDATQDGVVVGQAPSAGEKVPKAQVVQITVGRFTAGVTPTTPPGTEPTPTPAAEVEVPALVDRDEDEIGSLLAGTGLTYLVTRVDAPGKEGKVTGHKPAAGMRVAAGTQIEIFVGRPATGPERDVPDVVLMGRADAERALADGKFAVKVTDEDAPPENVGKVVRQAPVAGAKAPEGSTVELFVGREAAAPVASVVVPEVVGRAQADAEQALADAGFVPFVSFADAPAASAGKVLSQTPIGGLEAAKGSRVELSVGRAAETPAQPPTQPPPTAPESVAPDYLGLDRADAEGRARAAGLAIRTVFEDVGEEVRDGIVLSQSPPAGDPLPADTPVEVVVSRRAAPSTPSAPMTHAVPDVLGKSEAEATSALRGESFLVKVTYVPSDQDGVVIGLSPAAGTRQPERSSVEISVGQRPVAPVPPETVRPTPPQPPPTQPPPTQPPPVEPPVEPPPVEPPVQPPPVQPPPVEPPIEPPPVQPPPYRPPSATPPQGNASVVPDVVGLSRTDAETRLRQAGFTARAVGEQGTGGGTSGRIVDGFVVSQSPPAGETATKASFVEVSVSSPQGDGSYAVVPDLRGRAGTDAVSALLAAGLVPMPVADGDPRATPGRVRTQSPQGGASARTGSPVRLHVGTGFDARATQVPNVVGLTSAEAQARLRGLGYQVQVVRANVRAGVFSWSGSDRIVVQWPRGAVPRAQASPVTLWTVGP